MSKFMSVYTEDLSYVSEGWASAVLPYVTGGLAATLAPVSGIERVVIYGAVHYGTPKAINKLSVFMMKRILENPILQKYIINECDKEWKKTQKEEPTYTKNCPSKTTFNGDFFLTNSLAGHFKNRGVGIAKVGEYTILLFGDTTHIESVHVAFFDKKERKYRWHKLPAPTKEDIKKLGYEQVDPDYVSPKKKK